MSDWEHEEGEHWAQEAARYRRMLAPYGDALLAAAAASNGERALDVGCGNGDLALALAEAVGPEGEVLGVDLSPAMLAVATERARAAGADQVRYVAADAAVHRPEPADFDLLASRFGAMFFPDPPAAFAHLRSLLRPGGRLALACWQDLSANEWLVVPGAAAAQLLPLPVPEPGAPSPFALADPDHTRGLLTAAGFTDIEVAEHRAPLWMGHDPEDATRFLRATGMGRALFAEADPATTDRASALVVEALRPHHGPEGVVLGGAAWLVTARS